MERCLQALLTYLILHAFWVDKCLLLKHLLCLYMYVHLQFFFSLSMMVHVYWKFIPIHLRICKCLNHYFTQRIFFIYSAEDCCGERKTSTGDPSDLDMTCNICLEHMSCDLSDQPMDIEDRSSRIILLPRCRHFYHFDCLWSWLSHREIGSCPSCRCVVDRSEVKVIRS